MTSRPHPRIRLEVDHAKLRHNFSRIRRRVAPCGVIAVLKANAYGLGVTPIAETLAAAGAAGFAAAEPREALALARFGLPVQILGSVLPDELPETIAAGIVHPVDSLESARRISAETTRQGRPTTCQFLVDTGMGRLGILASRAEKVIREALTLPGLECNGIYSHFPVAQAEGEIYTHAQIDRFKKLLQNLAAHGIGFRHIHIANSDAVNHFPAAFRAPFTLVRTGIDLHGAFHPAGRRSLGLEPILRLTARLAAVRVLPAGMNVGYGLTHTLSADTRVGAVAIGYADGLPMALSNRGFLRVRDRLCPILGRVSMDYTTISLEAVPDAAVGDEVLCLDDSGEQEALTVEHWARRKGTHAYEILCSFGPRVARRHVNV